jgi:hypothetical protein
MGGGPGAFLGTHFVMSAVPCDSGVFKASALWSFDVLAPFGLVLGKCDGVVVVKARLDSRLKERAVEIAPCRLNMRGMDWRSDCDQSAYNAM